MPLSTAIANIEIQLQDGQQAGIPPVIFRTVPPVMFPSNVQVGYNGYVKIPPGQIYTLIGAGGIAQSEGAFVYVRNLPVSGPMLLKATGASGSGIMELTIKPGGVFFFGNGTVDPALNNFINALTIEPVGNALLAVIAEWMVAH